MSRVDVVWKGGGYYYTVDIDTTLRGDMLAFEVYRALWVGLLADSAIFLVDDGRPVRLIHRFDKALKRDFMKVAHEYSKLRDLILRNVTDENADGLLHLPGSILPAFVKTPVYRLVKRLTEIWDYGLYQYLLSFFGAGKKIPLREDPSLEATALRGWLAVEGKLLAQSYSGLPSWVEALQLILQETLLPHFHHTPLPKHGPGHVAEAGIKSLLEKCNTVYAASVVDTISVHYEPGFAPEFIDPKAFMPEGARIVDMDIEEARVTFAPKDIRTFRTICMEPTGHQHGQQSVRYALEKAIEDGPLGSYIRIADQGENQRAAVIGSLLSHTATLDLSFASDSFSYILAKAVFPKEIWYFLDGTRSKTVVLPDNTRVAPFKFAPMGSAVCFPSQTIFYCSVVLFAYMHHYLGTTRRGAEWTLYDTAEYIKKFGISQIFSLISLDNHPPAGRRLYSKLYVYGDDIICDTRVAELVTRLLDALSFQVNVGKSFSDRHPVRESCGIYAITGVDVTPISLKLKGFVRGITPSLLVGLIDLANRADDLGYPNLAAIAARFAYTLPSYRRRSKEQLPRPLPVGTPNGLSRDYGFTPKFKRRSWKGKPATDKTPMDHTHTRYMRDEYRALVVEAHANDELRDASYSYTLWQRSPTPSLEPTILGNVWKRDQDLRLAYKWLPE